MAALRRQNFLDEEEIDDEAAPTLTINADYAQRFEYNKKRQELSRLEEKAKLQQLKDDDDSSSDDEDEDDAAELATAELDDEILATLQAIKNKDPRRLDPKVTFYRDFENAEGGEGAEKVKSEKPMYLQDYHRENYMKGMNGEEVEEDEEVVPTYQQEQDQLKRELVGSMHAAGKSQDNEDEDDFLVAKSRSRHEDLPPLKKSKSKKAAKITDADVKDADKDPETFLSNFMAARAWLPSNPGSRFAPLESDDSDDDARADEFEEAYNLRFEDPAKANEKLASFARDVGKYGVRRDEKTGRAKARDREKERKEALKKELEEDKARLRKLKIEEAEEKVKKIKEAAGLRGKDVDLDAWRGVIEGDFDDDKWEEEMKRRFGEDYYAAGSDEDEEGSDEETAAAKRKAKKPKWNDDIDIGDLIPDFDAGDKPTVSLSDVESEDEEADGGVPVEEDDESGEEKKKKPKSKKDRAREKSEAKRASRKERMQIESIVDSTLPLTMAPTAGFRYRETSPNSFGLSARDILFADDAALNEFAGLKKMAAFRDDEKKRRDKKKFGKKARLKAWRREQFGDAEEPTGGFEKIVTKDGEAVEMEKKRWTKKRKADDGEGDVEEGAKEVAADGETEGKRKKKRSKKNKG